MTNTRTLNRSDIIAIRRVVRLEGEAAAEKAKTTTTFSTAGYRRPTFHYRIEEVFTRPDATTGYHTVDFNAFDADVHDEVDWVLAEDIKAGNIDKTAMQVWPGISIEVSGPPKNDIDGDCEQWIVRLTDDATWEIVEQKQ
jgi:hypothetical protein